MFIRWLSEVKLIFMGATTPHQWRSLIDYHLSNIIIILLLVDASTAVVPVTATDGALPPSLEELTR